MITRQRATLTDDEQGRWAEASALQGDRTGMQVLACLHSEGRGFERNQEQAVALWKKAVGLGCVESLYRAACLLDLYDLDTYRCWGECLTKGYVPVSWALQEAATKLGKHFVRDGREDSGVALFEIGRVCRGRLEPDKCAAFGSALKMGPLLRAIAHFEASSAFARRAIDCWSVAGQRLGVVKDVRLLIAGLLWEERRCWGKVSRSF